MFKGFQRVLLPALLRHVASLVEFLEKHVVIFGIAEDGDAGVVLRGRTDQRNASNVDFLDGFRDGDVDLGDRVLERVEIAHHVVDLVDVLVRQILFVRGQVPPPVSPRARPGGEFSPARRAFRGLW